MLTDSQWTILNTQSSEGIRQARSSGELPDCPEVNSRIAKRCFWENPNCYTHGKWFFADYVNAQFRHGRVAVRKISFPDESVKFTVVGPNGRWSDSLTIEEAKKHLKSHRKNNQIVYLNDEEAKKADNDWCWSMSR
jgi:hypothetical protein